MSKELRPSVLVVMREVRAVHVMVGEGENWGVIRIPPVVQRGIGVQLIVEVRIKGPQGIVESRPSWNLFTVSKEFKR